MRRFLIAVVVLVVAVTQANGAEFCWNQGVIPVAGETLQIDIINDEVVYDSSGNLRPGGIVTALGDSLFGIGKVTGIHSALDGTTYWSPAADQEIVMEFSGYSVTRLPTIPGVSDITFSGGMIEWYFDSTPDYNRSTGPVTPGWTSVAADNGVGNAGDMLWFDTVGVAGRDATYPLATLVSRDSQITVVNGSEIWLTGIGQGLLGISGYYSLPEPFKDNQIMLFDNKFTTHYEDDLTTPGTTTYVPWESINGWSLNSVDPVITTFVPEPPSLLLLLSCVLGLGWMRRRRRA